MDEIRIITKGSDVIAVDSYGVELAKGPESEVMAVMARATIRNKKRHSLSPIEKLAQIFATGKKVGNNIVYSPLIRSE